MAKTYRYIGSTSPIVNCTQFDLEKMCVSQIRASYSHGRVIGLDCPVLISPKAGCCFKEAIYHETYQEKN